MDEAGTVFVYVSPSEDGNCDPRSRFNFNLRTVRNRIVNKLKVVVEIS